jgi:hypothetical protein
MDNDQSVIFSHNLNTIANRRYTVRCQTKIIQFTSQRYANKLSLNLLTRRFGRTRYSTPTNRQCRVESCCYSLTVNIPAGCARSYGSLLCCRSLKRAKLQIFRGEGSTRDIDVFRGRAQRTLRDTVLQYATMYSEVLQTTRVTRAM